MFAKLASDATHQIGIESRRIQPTLVAGLRSLRVQEL